MMIRARGFSFEMTLDQQVARLEQMSRMYEEAAPTALKAMGVQAVSWAVQDYRARSDGKSAAGVSWKEIGKGAAISRLRHRAPWANDRSKLEKIREEEKPLKEMLRRKLPRGGKKKPNRQAIANQFMETREGKKLGKLKNRRKSIREKRKEQIAKEYGSARTGIDTGRLINSLVYGVSELASGIPGLIPGIRVPEPRDNSSYLTDDEKIAAQRKPADFEVSGSVIHLGSNMRYAAKFAEKRPIFPTGFISEERRNKLKALAKKAVDLEFKNRYG